MIPVPRPRTFRPPVTNGLEGYNTIRVSLCVTGVKKRCRKPDFHLFRVKDYDRANVDRNEAHRLAFDIFQANMKSATEAHLSFTPIKIEGGIESHMIFSGQQESLRDPNATVTAAPATVTT